MKNKKTLSKFTILLNNIGRRELDNYFNNSLKFYFFFTLRKTLEIFE